MAKKMNNNEILRGIVIFVIIIGVILGCIAFILHFNNKNEDFEPPVVDSGDSDGLDCCGGHDGGSFTCINSPSRTITGYIPPTTCTSLCTWCKGLRDGVIPDTCNKKEWCEKMLKCPLKDGKNFCDENVYTPAGCNPESSDPITCAAGKSPSGCKYGCPQDDLKPCHDWGGDLPIQATCYGTVALGTSCPNQSGDMYYTGQWESSIEGPKCQYSPDPLQECALGNGCDTTVFE